MSASQRRVRGIGALGALTLVLAVALAVGLTGGWGWWTASPEMESTEQAAAGQAAVDEGAIGQAKPGPAATGSTTEHTTESAPPVPPTRLVTAPPGQLNEVEPNGSGDLAQPLRPGEWIRGAVDPRHSGASLRDVDVFALEASAGAELGVLVRSAVDKSVVVRDPAGVELMSDRGTNVHRESMASRDGPVLVEVTGQSARYDLCVEASGATCARGVVRVAGPNPHSRAAQLSSLLPTRPATAVLAGGGPAELTVGGSLAVRLRSPLLSLPAVGISQPVGQELMRLRCEHVIVLGGTAVEPDTGTRKGVAVARAAAGYALGPTPPEVTTIRGEDAVTTAASVARRFPSFGRVVYVVSEFDAASAINIAVLLARTPGPVLLTRHDEVPVATAKALARLLPHQIVIVGGTRAISSDVAARLGRYAGALAPVLVTRVDTDPRETSATVAAGFPEKVGEAYLVSLADPAGALAAAVVAARTGAPVLVTGFELTADVEEALARLQPQAVFIVGGPGVIGTRAEASVLRTLRSS